MARATIRRVAGGRDAGRRGPSSWHNPNSRTGTWMETAALARLLEHLPETRARGPSTSLYRIVDAPGLIGGGVALCTFPNLVVSDLLEGIRMAELRVGYAVAVRCHCADGAVRDLQRESARAAAALAALGDFRSTCVGWARNAEESRVVCAPNCSGAAASCTLPDQLPAVRIRALAPVPSSCVDCLGVVPADDGRLRLG